MAGRRSSRVAESPVSSNDNPMLWLQPKHFLKLANGKLVLWDYHRHAQFEIDEAHLRRLIEFSAGAVPRRDEIDPSIVESGVLVDGLKPTQWKWDWLAHIFHYGTSHPLPPNESQGEDGADYARSYLEYCESLESTMPAIEIRKRPPSEAIALPRPSHARFEEASLWSTLMQRRTCRDFNGKAVSVNTLSDLLHCTFADTLSPDPTVPADILGYGYRRTSPSAGGLQSIEPYVWAINVEGLSSGLYHYLSRHHELERMGDCPPMPIGTYLCHQDWANDLAFAVIMTARFDKVWWKYPHSRAYRPILMEVGHLSQTLNLAITALGIHPWLTGYFHDEALRDILSCEEDVEHPLLVVGGGNGSGSSIARSLRAVAVEGR